MERGTVQIGLACSPNCRRDDHRECCGLDAPLDLTSNLSLEGAPEIRATVCSCSCHWQAWDEVQRRGPRSLRNDGAWTWNGSAD
jgi:hypothetical protein